MTPLATYWHPWFSYEWWAEIGTGLLGVVAATIVGGVTVWIARRSNRVAQETVEYTKRVRDEDEKRQERDRLRQAQLERIAFAGLVRTWVRAVDDADWNGPGSEFSDVVAGLRAQLGDFVYDFDQSGRQELLRKIDEIVSMRVPNGVDPQRFWKARNMRKGNIPLLIEGYVAGRHLPHFGLPKEA